MSVQKSDSQIGEIDIVSFLLRFWNQRKLIFKITLGFLLFGFFIAVFSANEYTASTTFIPVGQNNSSVSGGLGSLASLAGISLGGNSGSSDISPDLYPKVVRSIPFQKEMLETKLSISGLDSLVTYKDYYQNIHKRSIIGSLRKYTIGIPSLVRDIFKGKKNDIIISNKRYNFPVLTKEDFLLIEKLNKQVNLDVNSKEGYVTIEATFTEALGSAELALRFQELLQDYILNFKTQKSLEELSFLKSRFAEKEEELNIAKLSLAKFQDGNISLNTALGRARLMDLQSEYDLLFAVYSELAKQIEAQQFQVKKSTPIFTVLKPVVVPQVKSGPDRIFTLISFAFLGVLFGVLFILSKDYFLVFSNRIAKEGKVNG